MHRRIAKFLLLFAVMGNLAPVALAISAPAPHACCVRKPLHHQREAAVAAEQLALQSSQCCNHDCCRAVSTARWAQAQSPIGAFFAGSSVRALDLRHPAFVSTGILGFQPSRAPPHSAIA